MRLAKKLSGVKNAWKSLTSRVQSNLHNLNISKAKTYAAHALTGLSFVRRFFSCKRLRKRLPFKKSYSALSYDLHHYQRCDQQQFFQKGFSAIYVDKLFAEGGAGETGKGKQVVAESSEGGGGEAKRGKGDGLMETKGSEKRGCTFSEAWKAAMASSTQFRGVDERAEEFISKFHQNVELEREKSIIDFQDMLKRSA